MGSWGTGVFQDDFACDLRDFYNELISLRFDDDEVFAEVQREFAGAEGIDQSTFWIALAFLEHRTGRLTDEVRRQACDYIDSGRALNDWIELTEPGDPSIRSREKQLLKVKAAILSPQPPRKTPRPSSHLKQRIGKTYESYPWKAGHLYAYRTKSGEYLILAAADVHPVKLKRHYAKQGTRYVRAEMPELFQPIFLLLDYRKPALPSAAELRRLRPYVSSSTKAERQSWLKTIEEIRSMFETESAQSFAEFERENRIHHPGKSDAQFRQRYLEYVDYCKEELRKYSDPERALQRQFYKRLMLDPKEPVPREQVTDLQTTRQFDRERECVGANWETIEACLALPGLGEKRP